MRELEIDPAVWDSKQAMLMVTVSITDVLYTHKTYPNKTFFFHVINNFDMSGYFSKEKLALQW